MAENKFNSTVEALFEQLKKEVRKAEQADLEGKLHRALCL